MSQREAARPAPSISVVVPVFGDGAALEELARRTATTLDSLSTRGWELLLVDDGSPARTWPLIATLAARRPEVRGIKLQRNFGQHNALLAGIRSSRGDVVVTIDDDLQHEPEAIPALVEALEDADLVYGCPSTRPRGVGRSLSSMLLKAALASVLGVAHARHISPFRAFRGPLREVFRDFRGPYVSIDVLLAWATTRIRAVPVEYRPRREGRSGYTLRRLVSLAITMVVGFSIWPLRLASLIGLACAAFGGLVLAFVLVRYLAAGTTVPGFAFLASVIAIFSGAQLFALGIIGEYLARMYFRMMDRPAYVIEARAVAAEETAPREATVP
jgi:glycosyltransferase involved in cell wall biosynthesis